VSFVSRYLREFTTQSISSFSTLKLHGIWCDGEHYERRRFQVSVSQITRELDQHRMLDNRQWSRQRPQSLRRSDQPMIAPVLRQVVGSFDAFAGWSYVLFSFFFPVYTSDQSRRTHTLSLGIQWRSGQLGFSLMDLGSSGVETEFGRDISFD